MASPSHRGALQERGGRGGGWGTAPRAKQSSPSQAIETALTLGLNSLRSRQSWSELQIFWVHMLISQMRERRRDGRGLAVTQPGTGELGLKSSVLTPEAP